MEACNNVMLCWTLADLPGLLVAGDLRLSGVPPLSRFIKAFILPTFIELSIEQPSVSRFLSVRFAEPFSQFGYS